MFEFLVVLLLLIKVLILWDFVGQMGGLNASLSSNYCEWRTKKIKHFKFLFPKKYKLESYSPVTPEHLYFVIFCFQLALYVHFVLSLVNYTVRAVLLNIGVNIDFSLYLDISVLADLLINFCIVGIADFVVYRKIKKMSDSRGEYIVPR